MRDPPKTATRHPEWVTQRILGITDLAARTGFDLCRHLAIRDMLPMIVTCSHVMAGLSMSSRD